MIIESIMHTKYYFLKSPASNLTKYIVNNVSDTTETTIHNILQKSIISIPHELANAVSCVLYFSSFLRATSFCFVESVPL